MDENLLLLLDAAAFAARAHDGQLRKDGQTPYVSHVFRVCLILRHLFGVDDPRILTAAILHDTIEDTTTDFDDLSQRYGAEVAEWVALLSKDKRLPEPERERLYAERLGAAPWQVKLCKLADIYDNLNDSSHFPPAKRAKTFENARRYLHALQKDLGDRVQEPHDTVLALLTSLERAHH